MKAFFALLIILFTFCSCFKEPLLTPRCGFGQHQGDAWVVTDYDISVIYPYLGMHGNYVNMDCNGGYPIYYSPNSPNYHDISNKVRNYGCAIVSCSFQYVLSPVW